VLLNTLNIGTMPLEEPLVPLMYELEARMLWHARPMPPAYFEITAHCWEIKWIDESSVRCAKLGLT
jgi:hypothetical protein